MYINHLAAMSSLFLSEGTLSSSVDIREKTPQQISNMLRKHNITLCTEEQKQKILASLDEPIGPYQHLSYLILKILEKYKIKFNSVSLEDIRKQYYVILRNITKQNPKRIFLYNQAWVVRALILAWKKANPEKRAQTLLDIVTPLNPPAPISLDARPLLKAQGKVHMLGSVSRDFQTLIDPIFSQTVLRQYLKLSSFAGGLQGVYINDPSEGQGQNHTEGLAYLMLFLAMRGRKNYKKRLRDSSIITFAPQELFYQSLVSLVKIFIAAGKNGRPAWLVSNPAQPRRETAANKNFATDANQDMVFALQIALHNLQTTKIWTDAMVKDPRNPSSKILLSHLCTQLLNKMKNDLWHDAVVKIKLSNGNTFHLLTPYHFSLAKANQLNTYLVNLSYLATGYYRAWGNSWSKLAQDAYTLITQVLKSPLYQNQTGPKIIPDWIVVTVNPNGTLSFAIPKDQHRPGWTNKYSRTWNNGKESIRVPWRLAQDVLSQKGNQALRQKAIQALNLVMQGKEPHNVIMASWNNQVAVAMYYAGAKALAKVLTEGPKKTAQRLAVKFHVRLSALCRRGLPAYCGGEYQDANRYYNQFLTLLAMLGWKRI